MTVYLLMWRLDNVGEEIDVRSIVLLVLLYAAVPVAAEVQIEKLTWAGIKMVHGDTTVFIDAVGTDIWNGNAPGGLAPVTADTSRRYALITHVHNDHFDPITLHSVLGERGYAIVPESEATYVASRGLKVIPAPMWEPVARGGFLFTAVPAVDGLGDKQVSWVITVDNKRFFHGGDTLWHGYWSTFGQLFGPFELTFMPVNGARVMQEPMPESPVSLTPTQAVDAALMLGAGEVIPIHYGLNDPPYYLEYPEALERTLEEAGRRDVDVIELRPGDKVIR